MHTAWPSMQTRRQAGAQPRRCETEQPASSRMHTQARCRRPCWYQTRCRPQPTRQSSSSADDKAKHGFISPTSSPVLNKVLPVTARTTPAISTMQPLSCREPRALRATSIEDDIVSTNAHNVSTFTLARLSADSHRPHSPYNSSAPWVDPRRTSAIYTTGRRRSRAGGRAVRSSCSS